MEKSLFRKLLNLAVVLLIVHAGWKIGPIVFRHFDFKDQVTQTARFSAGQSAVQLKGAVLALAEREGVPLDERALTVEKSGDRIRVDVTYTELLEVLPRYFYPYEFTIVVDTLLARPTSLGEIR